MKLSLCEIALYDLSLELVGIDLANQDKGAKDCSYAKYAPTHGARKQHLDPSDANNFIPDPSMSDGDRDVHAWRSTSTLA